MITGQVITPEDILALGDTSNSKIVVKDDVFDETSLVALLDDVKKISSKDNLLSTAKMGSKNSLVDSHILRGDEICWVTPDLCKELGLSAMKLFVQTMIKMIKPFQQDLGLMPDYSLQYALYSGNASGYVKHLDFNKAQYKGHGTVVRGRKLTVILYLNREWEGGQLRVHLPSPVTTADEDFKGFFDIDPLLGRLVIFRSDYVEHEVLPCHKDRSALTFWISADYLINTQVPSYIPLVDSKSYSNNEDADNNNSVSTPKASTASSIEKENILNSGDNIDNDTINDDSNNDEDITMKSDIVSVSAVSKCPLLIPSYTPFSLSPEHWDSRTIFVSIASYCDSECGPTIKDLFSQASHPGLYVYIHILIYICINMSIIEFFNQVIFI
jgi:SM-20-related protein